jgi:hypothetical protein
MNYTPEQAHIGPQSTAVGSNGGEYAMKSMCQSSKQLCLTYVDKLYGMVYNSIPIYVVGGRQGTYSIPIDGCWVE